jgi:hypothetical protein
VIKELPIADYPDWLASITPSSMIVDPFPLQALLKDSLYYPSCGFDGSPVKHLGGHIYSFIYVDYGYNKDAVFTQLEKNGFKGYRTLAQRDICKDELTPNGWSPELPKLLDGRLENEKRWIKPPFCLWSILEREDKFTENHGPKRFSLLYLCADGSAAFQALYVSNHSCPKVIAIIQPGEGFGGNWTNFHDPEKILARTVMNNPAGQPEYLLYGGYGWPQWYQEPCWPWYKRRVGGSGRTLWAKN